MTEDGFFEVSQVGRNIDIEFDNVFYTVKQGRRGELQDFSIKILYYRHLSLFLYKKFIKSSFDEFIKNLINYVYIPHITFLVIIN